MFLILLVFYFFLHWKTAAKIETLWKALNFESCDTEIVIITEYISDEILFDMYIPTEYIALLILSSNTEESELTKLRFVNNTASLIYFFTHQNASTVEEVINKISSLDSFFRRNQSRAPIYVVEATRSIPNQLFHNDIQSQNRGIRTFLPFEFSNITLNTALFLLYESSDTNNRFFAEVVGALEKVNSVNDTYPTKYYWQEVYSIKNHNFEHILHSNGKTIHIYDVIATHHRRQDFNGVSISGTAQEHPERKPAADFSFPNNTPKFQGGFEVQVYWYLRDALNFTEKAVKGSGWVSQDENGKLHGMAAQVLDNEADISISSSEILMHLTTQLEFLIPTYHSNMWAFFKQPSALSIRNVFTHPFTAQLWLVILSTWGVVLTALLLIAHVKSRQTDIYENDVETSRSSFIWAITLICQKGWYCNPESISLKIIHFSGLVTGLLTYVAYSAELVSILSIHVIPIKSFVDILDNKFTIYSDKFLISTHFSRENESSKLASDPKEIITEDAIPAITKLIKSRAAILDISDSFYPWVRRYASDLNISRAEDVICEVVSVVSVNGKKVKGGTFIKKGSPFKALFNYKILTMYERGVRHRLMNNYFGATGLKCGDSLYGAYEHNPFGLTELFTAFAVLLSLSLFSIVILILERFYYTSIIQHR